MDLLTRVSRKIKSTWWQRGKHVSTAAPIVVGGCGRSGTTLMRVILDSHHAICCGPESSLFFPAVPDSEKLDDLARRFDLSVDEVRAMFRSYPTQAEFVDHFFAAYCKKTGKARWAEKTPRNVRCLDFIFQHFPSARFIHMIRDGRDVCCSLRTHPKFKVVDGKLIPTGIRNPWEQCVGRWVADTRLGLSYRNHPAYFEVRYEDLVADSEPVLRKLFQWLGEEWDDNVLNHHEQQGESRDVTKFAQNAAATKPIYRSAMGRWRWDMTVEEAELLQQRSENLLVELGYAQDATWTREITTPEKTAANPAVA